MLSIVRPMGSLLSLDKIKTPSLSPEMQFSLKITFLSNKFYLVLVVLIVDQPKLLSLDLANVEPRRSKRPIKATSFGPDFLTNISENDPTTYQEAMQSLDAAFWKEASL
eukprot:TRINITY_DN46070_c0_g1_i1.p1 TRINITY_DN46070_c0_g1~~TRINITY_DN46070_c0_g1_i1.p1  ORF type:complete len:109 (+),score=14.42 TRINITY_DN46070_c0_g1_i1:304-630(+)